MISSYQSSCAPFYADEPVFCKINTKYPCLAQLRQQMTYPGCRSNARLWHSSSMNGGKMATAYAPPRVNCAGG